MILEQFEFFWNFDLGMVRPQLSQVESERNVPQVVIVLGLRRVGKSTLLAQMAHRLGSDQFYNVNFEDDRFLGTEADDSNHLYQILLIANSQSDIICNADMRVGEIRQFCKLQDEGQSLMRAAVSQMNLSARAYNRTQILKLVRALAGAAGSKEIRFPHLAAAMQYRPKLRVG